MADKDDLQGELADLLVTGPFEQALRVAISGSGLSLERVRSRLERRGISISLATLSHWQSGRSQPERPDSLVALSAVEEVVGLKPGALRALIGSPRPRGRFRSRKVDGLPIDAIWPRADDLTALHDEFDLQDDDSLTRLSHHDLIELGPDCSERSLRVRQVMRAERDGISRMVNTFHVDIPNAQAPTILAVRHCRVQRTVWDPKQGYLVFAMEFDRVLNRGDSMLLEYEVLQEPPYAPSTNFERKLRLPVRDYVLEVAFHPEALPVRCHHAMRDTIDDRPKRVHGLTLVSNSVQVVRTDASPGLYGVFWQWD